MTSQFPDFSDFLDEPNSDIQVSLDSLIRDHPCMESIFRKFVPEDARFSLGQLVHHGRPVHDIVGWTKLLDAMVDLSSDSIQECVVRWIESLIDRYADDAGDMSFILSPASFLDIAHFVEVVVRVIESLPLDDTRQFIELHFYKILDASLAAMNTTFRVRGCSQWFDDLSPDSEESVSVGAELAVTEFLLHDKEADVLFCLDLLIELQKNDMDWISELSQADLDDRGLADPRVPIHRGVMEFIQKYRDMPFDWAMMMFRDEKRDDFWY